MDYTETVRCRYWERVFLFAGLVGAWLFAIGAPVLLNAVAENPDQAEVNRATGIMLAVLVTFRRSFLTDTLTHRIASGLMIAGIMGNLGDRLRLGYVVDFLDFHLGDSHFPSFNVADSAICIGVGLYILSQVFGGDAHRVKGGQ